MKKILLATIATCCMATTMHAQDNWTMKVTMKSGEVKEYPCNDVKDVTFSNSDNSYYADVAATNTYNLYYGAVSEQLAAYTLHLCDGKLSKGGLPTEINKHDIRLTVLAKPSQNPAGAALPGGTYKLVNSTEKAGVYGKQSVYIETNKVNADGQVDGFLDSLATCNLNVERRVDGTYKLLVEGELRDHGKVRFAYDGKLEFVNKDPAAGYQTITEDVNFVPRTMSGRYVKANDTYCDYTITFLNCDTDDEGFIVGAGEYLNLVLLTEHKVPMDINTIVGTYDVVMPVAGKGKVHWRNHVQAQRNNLSRGFVLQRVRRTGRRSVRTVQRRNHHRYTEQWRHYLQGQLENARRQDREDGIHRKRKQDYRPVATASKACRTQQPHRWQGRQHSHRRTHGRE